MVLPHVISQREDSAPWTTTICQTMHRVAIAPITDHTPTKNARNVRCDVTGRPARCWMWCAGSHDLTSPLRTRASHPHAGCAGLQPAYSDTPPGSAGFQPASSDMPPGCAGVQPACRERGLPACLSDMPRLGARASSPHAGSAGVSPAYSDTPHHPCTVWVRGRPARMPGARASSLPQRYAPLGCAGVQPACRERGLPARLRRPT